MSLMTFLYVVPIGVVIGWVIYLLYALLDYNQDRNDYSLKITAKTVKDWYSLNKNRYVLNSNRVYIKTNTSDSIDDCYKAEMKNFFEYLKYQHFLERLYKENRKRETEKLTIESRQEHLQILSLVQSDIDNMRIKAEQEFKIVADTCNETQNRLVQKSN